MDFKKCIIRGIEAIRKGARELKGVSALRKPALMNSLKKITVMKRTISKENQDNNLTEKNLK